jgi:hypothetical protein
MKRPTAGAMLKSLYFVLLWVALISAAHAQDNIAGCSLSTLKGTYSVQGQGTVVAQLPGLPAPPFPFAEVAVDFLDGSGNISGKFTANVNGVVIPGTVSGTYTVGSDCTGLISMQTNSGIPVDESFVVLRTGDLRLVQTDSYLVITRTMEKIRD